MICHSDYYEAAVPVPDNNMQDFGSLGTRETCIKGAGADAADLRGRPRPRY